jgi:hypothetical protein
VAGLLIVAASAASSAVELGGDGVGDVGQLLELLVEVLGGSLSVVLAHPVLSLLDGLEERLLVIVLDLAAKTLVIVELVLEAIGVVLELVARLNALTGGLVLLGVLLSLLNHALDFLGGEAALVVGDGDGLALTGTLVDSADLEDTVSIKLKGDLDLGNTAGSGTVMIVSECSCNRADLRNVGELELAEVVTVEID